VPHPIEKPMTSVASRCRCSISAMTFLGHRGIDIGFPLAGLVRCAEAAHVGQDGSGTGGAQGMRKAGSTFGGRIRQRKRPAENLAKHLLQVFVCREYALEVSELTQCVDAESVQQDNGRAFAPVVVGDVCSVKGRKCVQIGPQTQGSEIWSRSDDGIAVGLHPVQVAG